MLVYFYSSWDLEKYVSKTFLKYILAVNALSKKYLRRWLFDFK